MTTQIDDLILRTKGEEELRQLKEQLKAVDEELRRSIQQFGVHDSATRLVATQYQDLANQIQATEVSINRAGGAMGPLTQSFTQISYVINDAQQIMYGFDRGLIAISNNIPGLVNAAQTLGDVGIKGITTALAGPAGLILGLTTVSTLVPIISASWGKLQDLFGMGETATEAERMERLAKATNKTVMETEALIRYKREQSTLERLREGEPEAVAKARKEAEKVVIEAGFRDVTEALVGARFPTGKPLPILPEEQERLDELEQMLERVRQPEFVGGVQIDTTARQRRVEAEIQATRVRFQEQALERERQRAQADIGKAFVDPARYQAFLAELRGAGGQFPSLAEELAQKTPEAMRAQQVRDRLAGVGETLSKGIETFWEKVNKSAEKLTKQHTDDLQKYIDEDQKESDRLLKRREQQHNRSLQARATSQRQQEQEEEQSQRKIEQALGPIAAGAEMEIIRGQIGRFPSRRQQVAYQTQIDAMIRRETESRLLASGESLTRAAELGQRAPGILRENLQHRFLALQARGLNAQQAQQALVQQLLGDISQIEARISRIEQTNGRQFRQRQQMARNAQNRGR